MRNLKILFLTSVISIFSMCGVGIAGKTALPIVLYNLLPGTSFQEGCVGPCMCPVMMSGDVQGTFGLVAKSSGGPEVNNFSLRDISWVVLDPTGQLVHTITGEGTYRFRTVGTGTQKHQLTLKISIDGQAPVVLDSGHGLGCSLFPDFSISVRRGTKCFDIWMDIIAAPAGQTPSK